MSQYGFAFRRTPDIKVAIGESDLARPVVDKPRPIPDPFGNRVNKQYTDRVSPASQLEYKP